MELRKKQRVIDCIIADIATQRILIQQRAPTRKLFPLCWDFFGGHVEEGETVEACLKRELFEESGMELVSVLAQVHEFYWSYDMYDVTDTVYVVTAHGQLCLEEGKAIDARWIERSEIHLLLKPGEMSNDMFSAAIKAFDYLEHTKAQ